MFKYLAEKDVVRFNVILDTLVNFSATFYVSWSIAITATIYGYRQKILRQKNIKEMGKRIDNLEKILWPNKYSSNINEDGTKRGNI